MMQAAKTTRTTNRYGLAQEAFIKKTREAVKADLKFFEKNDWSRISLKPGLRNTSLNRSNDKAFIDVQSFYVRDLAVWIPHMIIKDHTPTCPKCERNKFVMPTGTWAGRPKVLYGLRKHRYLDSIYYKCHSAECGGKLFSGCNERSLQLDAVKIVGVFNFHLTSGCGVDEELYSYITNHSNDTTASIYKRIALMTTDEWMNDALYYYTAVRKQKVILQREGTLAADSRQRTLDRHLVKQAVETPRQKRQRTLKAEKLRLERAIAAKKQAFETDVEFVNIFKMKANRNSTGLPFKGIGKAKILKLIERGITTAKELVNYDGTDPTVLPQWKAIVENYYEGIETEMAGLMGELAKLNEDLDWLAIEIDIEEDEFCTNGTADNRTPVVAQNNRKEAPPFSTIQDREQYNCQVISKNTIDRIVTTDFQHRKKIQENKMRGIKALVLKLDWHYKLPPKIKVFTGRGKSFSPFKSAASIQNEDAQTIFWKCYPCSEGIETMKEDLVRLKKRLELIQGEPPRLCYVDNCCQVRAKLQEIFGESFLVKLDCFHWCKRWDAVLFDTTVRRQLFFEE
jgi:hypothetical protein